MILADKLSLLYKVIYKDKISALSEIVSIYLAYTVE